MQRQTYAPIVAAGSCRRRAPEGGAHVSVNVSECVCVEAQIEIYK